MMALEPVLVMWRSCANTIRSVSLDHERHEGQARLPHRSRYLPAPLRGELHAGRLEPNEAIPIRDIRQQRRRRGVQSPTGDLERPPHHAPPGELHPDPSTVVDIVPAYSDHAVRPERDPQLPIAEGPSDGRTP